MCVYPQAQSSGSPASPEPGVSGHEDQETGGEEGQAGPGEHGVYTRVWHWRNWRETPEHLSSVHRSPDTGRALAKVHSRQFMVFWMIRKLFFPDSFSYFPILYVLLLRWFLLSTVQIKLFKSYDNNMTYVLFQCAASPGRNTPIPLKTVTTNTTPHQFCNNLVCDTFPAVIGIWTGYLQSKNNFHFHSFRTLWLFVHCLTPTVTCIARLPDILWESNIWDWTRSNHLFSFCFCWYFENQCQCVFWCDAEICPRLSPLLLANV